jgi:hypothetical protein
MRHKKRIKKLTIDLRSQEIPEKAREIILKQTEIIEHQENELSVLRKENEELKKNFS